MKIFFLQYYPIEAEKIRKLITQKNKWVNEPIVFETTGELIEAVEELDEMALIFSSARLHGKLSKAYLFARKLKLERKRVLVFLYTNHPRASFWIDGILRRGSVGEKVLIKILDTDFSGLNRREIKKMIREKIILAEY